MANDPNEPRGPYGNALAETLYQRRTTITALALAIGVTRPDASELVNGWRLPSAEQLDAIARVLGAAPEMLYPTEEFRLAIEATRKANVA